ncbi:hypothetical protein Trydic_g10857 [Trypoxylus dichotomus]
MAESKSLRADNFSFAFYSGGAATAVRNDFSRLYGVLPLCWTEEVAAVVVLPSEERETFPKPPPKIPLLKIREDKMELT